MKKRTRWIIIIFVAILGLVVLNMTGKDAGIAVDTHRVARDTLQVLVTEEGQTRVRDRFTVSAPVSGRLARITLEEGDVVAEDARLALIYPMPESPRNLTIARAHLDAAEARRSEAEVRIAEMATQVEQMERELARRRVLAQDSILSKEELERGELAAAMARQQHEAAKAGLLAIEADVAAARAAIIGANPQGISGEPMSVLAPGAGRVLRVMEKNERIVMAGTPLIAIGQADQLEVVADVLSEDAVQIQAGNPVFIEEWGGGTLHGKVRLVEPDAFTKISALGVEEQRVNVVVDLFDAPSSLGSGYRVEAGIVTWTGMDVLTIPTNALFQINGNWHVFTVREGKAALQPVHIGHRSAKDAEVLNGLQEGDEVILFPSDQVQDGVAVQ